MNGLFFGMKKSLLFIIIAFFTFGCDTIQKTKLADEKNNEAIDLMNLGEFEKAIACLRIAVEADVFDDTKRSTFCRNLAIAFQQSEQPDSARVYFLRATNEAKVGSAQKELNAADVCLIDLNVTEAIEHLNKAALAGGEDLGVNNTLGIIYMGEYGDEFQDYGLAIKYNELAYAEDKSRPTLDVLARTYYEVDSLQKAHFHFTTLVNEYPQFPDYHYLLGAVEYELDNPEAAEIHFNEAIRLEPLYSDYIDEYYSIMSWESDSTLIEGTLTLENQVQE